MKPIQTKNTAARLAAAAALALVAGPAAWAQPAPATYYFSDCQAGASPSCVFGSNASPGTSPSAPKRDLNGFNFRALPAGARLLFARGAVWTAVQGAQLANYNATPAQPIVFDAYGSGARPWFKTPAGATAFNFYEYGVATVDGGYVLRNLRLDGEGVGQSGISQGWGTTHITLENMVIENFEIGLHLGDYSRWFTLRGSTVRNNRQHGLLGAGSDWLLEGNNFDRNGDARAPGTHAVYFSAGQDEFARLTVRNNTFVNNSLDGGRCRSGNLTVHGRIVGALIEGNSFITPGYGGGCRGVSIAAGYGSAEYMRDFTVRGNRFVNAGGAVAFSAAPGIQVLGNTVWDTLTVGAGLIETVGNNSGGNDDVDGAAVVRDNVLCKRFNQASSLINVQNPQTVANNTIRYGAEASTGPCTR